MKKSMMKRTQYIKKQSLYKVIIIIFLAFFGIYSFQFDENVDGLDLEPIEKVKRTLKSKAYSEYFKAITTEIGQEKNNYKNSYRFEELKKAKLLQSTTKVDLIWESRGPNNIGGRTRAIVIDSDDSSNSTWYTGAATGGIWKTTDKGNSWKNLTPNIPNLSTCALVMANSKHNVMYAGTGESFPGGTYMAGSGIFKTIDKGVSWELLTATSNNQNFEYVNRIVVDFNNENVLLAGTNSGIFKSIDGGVTWVQKYISKTNVEQIIADPSNFNVLYASVKYLGVLKSIDAGENWTLSIDGLSVTGRIELAVSTVNEHVVFASVDGDTPKVYISKNNANSWIVFKQEFGIIDFLGQGAYDNTIVAHPFDENIAFVGGVNINKINFSGTIEESETKILNAYTENTNSFLEFINFGGEFLSGGMTVDDEATDLLATDWSSVEIRFGLGKTQKAHRFTVNGEGSGVPVEDYIYQDYVDVPFEVWDITNNRQLMLSFRDQAEDGNFDLVERLEANPIIGREYLFVNAVEYDAVNPNENIAKNGGRAYKQLYFFWPSLSENGIWNAENLPQSKIVIEVGKQLEQIGTVTKIADAYGILNRYNQTAGYGETKIPGLHPDHHSLLIIPGNSASDPFTIINANDGGVAISEDSGSSFEMKINSYKTTQFYGLAKKHGANEYIGGLQDNGTWQSMQNSSANQSSNYYFRVGGDGFETQWNYTNTNKLLASIYYNDFYVSNDGGNTWNSASNGITYDIENNQKDGPFITKVASSKSKSDILYALGKFGVWKNTNFALGLWENKLIGDGWAPSGVTSQHNVEVSIANDNFVWAGAGMSDNYSLFVSLNEGNTYSEVSKYADVDMNAYLSAIATHPTEDSTAFALFSLQGKPKVLRTRNLGQTWTDLSGFSTKNKGLSQNGFPDVVVNDLIVMPYNTDVIWVGTDIGIFESIDEGETWHILASNLPSVSVYQMKIVDTQVILATHGRGIWTITIPELAKVPIVTNVAYNQENTLTLDVEILDLCDSVEIYLNGILDTVVSEYQVNNINSFDLFVNELGSYNVFVKAYSSGEVFESNSSNIQVDTEIPLIDKELKILSLYPNPSNGIVNFKLKIADIGKDYSIKVVNLAGKEVYLTKGVARVENQMNLSSLGNGQYLVLLYINNEFYVDKLLIHR